MEFSDLLSSKQKYIPSETPLQEAQLQFKNGNYGLAEQHFRKAVEVNPNELDAWLGLAASYDHLRRFDLAARAYDRAIKLAGPSPVVLNNMGYSYLLQGNLKEAKRKLTEAQRMDPDNPHIQANLELLREGIRRAEHKA